MGRRKVQLRRSGAESPVNKQPLPVLSGALALSLLWTGGDIDILAKWRGPGVGSGTLEAPQHLALGDIQHFGRGDIRVFRPALESSSREYSSGSDSGGEPWSAWSAPRAPGAGGGGLIPR